MSIGFTAREVIPRKPSSILHIFISSEYYLGGSNICGILYLRYVTYSFLAFEWDTYVFLGPGVVVSLTGRIAATYHVPFPVIVRSSLYVDVHIIAILRES